VGDVVAEDRLFGRRLDHRLDELGGAAERLAHVGLPSRRRVAAARLHTRRGPPVDPTLRKSECAERLAASEHLLREAGLERLRLHRRDAAPAAVAGVARLVTEKLPARRGVDPVGADQRRAALLATVLEPG